MRKTKTSKLNNRKIAKSGYCVIRGTEEHCTHVLARGRSQVRKRVITAAKAMVHSRFGVVVEARPGKKPNIIPPPGE
mgnify:CR=1 FL=1